MFKDGEVASGCFCKGDLCNAARPFVSSIPFLVVSVILAKFF